MFLPAYVSHHRASSKRGSRIHPVLSWIGVRTESTCHPHSLVRFEPTQGQGGKGQTLSSNLTIRAARGCLRFETRVGSRRAWLFHQARRFDWVTRASAPLHQVRGREAVQRGNGERCCCVKSVLSE